MTAITFDTHQLIRDLREVDFTEKQAETVVRVLSKSQERLVSTEHFDSKLSIMKVEIDGEFKLLKWMLGVSVAISISTLFMLIRLMMTLPGV